MQCASGRGTVDNTYALAVKRGGCRQTVRAVCRRRTQAQVHPLDSNKNASTDNLQCVDRPAKRDTRARAPSSGDSKCAAWYARTASAYGSPWTCWILPRAKDVTHTRTTRHAGTARAMPMLAIDPPGNRADLCAQLAAGRTPVNICVKMCSCALVSHTLSPPTQVDLRGCMHIDTYSVRGFVDLPQ